jgi:hypothetical protein
MSLAKQILDPEPFAGTGTDGMHRGGDDRVINGGNVCGTPRTYPERGNQEWRGKAARTATHQPVQ